MAVVTDVKKPNLSGFTPDVVAYSDYFPFGMVVPGRTGGTDYRYGFQGQEKDDEVKGSGNAINYKFRMHDPRVGRFFAVDPLAREYPHNSVYAFSENRVIDGVELEGLEYLEFGKKGHNAKPALHVQTDLTVKQLREARDFSRAISEYSGNVETTNAIATLSSFGSSAPVTGPTIVGAEFTSTFADVNTFILSTVLYFKEKNDGDRSNTSLIEVGFDFLNLALPAIFNNTVTKKAKKEVTSIVKDQATKGANEITQKKIKDVGEAVVKAGKNTVLNVVNPVDKETKSTTFVQEGHRKEEE